MDPAGMAGWNTHRSPTESIRIGAARFQEKTLKLLMYFHHWENIHMCVGGT
jgi:hypothetical protein